MYNIKEKDALEQELDLREKLVNNLIERRKQINSAQVVRVTPQKSLIQERHNKLSNEISQLRKRYAKILD